MNVSHRIGAASPLRGRVWPCLGDLAGTAEVTVAGSFDAQDRMLSYGTCQYEYTRNGELTRRTDSASGAVTNYQYDEFGNLRRVDLADARVVTYHIDGLNRRVGKSIDGVRQWGLLYANQLEPVAELDGAGNIVASFLYADRPHVPSLMLKGGHTYRILSDHLGSVRLVIDINDGSIAQRLAYDEYGNIVEDTNPGFQPFAYAGGLYDRDTGLTRFGARDYDAVAGRWTAKDPVGFSGRETNFYAYALLDPINYLDVEGKPAWLAVVVVIAGVIAAVEVGSEILDAASAGSEMAEKMDRNRAAREALDKWEKLSQEQQEAICPDPDMMNLLLLEQFNSARDGQREALNHLLSETADVAEETLVPDQLDALRALGKLHKILEAAK
ncbi:MAG: RHS repeat-associated core domain-containing protein [Xanthomonadales bacterium]|nr:RHS repeat-associated core domain-containing protein [Xanthomonadales bacterium]